MNLNYDEMLKAAQNPALKLCDFEIVNNGDYDELKFINPPKNYRLYAYPIFPENVALLEDLDYVSV